MGSCPRSPCFIITLLTLERDRDGTPRAAVFGLGGVWEGARLLSPGSYSATVPLKRGCSFTFGVPGYDITLVVEDSNVTSLRAGVGFSVESNDIEEGFMIKGTKCPEG